MANQQPGGRRNIGQIIAIETVAMMVVVIIVENLGSLISLYNTRRPHWGQITAGLDLQVCSAKGTYGRNRGGNIELTNPNPTKKKGETFLPQTVYCGVYSLKKKKVCTGLRAPAQLGVAWAWRGRGWGVRGLAWLGRGMGVAWTRLGRGRGLGVAWAWLGRGVGVAWAWRGLRTCSCYCEDIWGVFQVPWPTCYGASTTLTTTTTNNKNKKPRCYPQQRFGISFRYSLNEKILKKITGLSTIYV